MKRTLLAAIAVFIALAPLGGSASAGGYESGYYAGSEVYVARGSVPVYDCPRWACQTNIRLRAGSSVYATCWDGGEGWCKVQTRYFKNIFLPRYALDLAYGSYGYGNYYSKESYPGHGKSYGNYYSKESYPSYGKSYGNYYSKESYPRYGKSYDDCYYKDRYYRKGRYAEGCYEKYNGPYSDRGDRYGSAATEYGYERPYKQRDYKREEYAPDEYNGDGYRGD